MDLADAVQHKFSLAFACWGLGFAYVAQGDLAQGARVLERAVATCRDWNLLSLHSVVAGPLGLARARSGRAEEAVVLLRGAMAGLERLSVLPDGAPASPGATVIDQNPLPTITEYCNSGIN